MDFRTFQDGMFPKCRRLFLCRAQILPGGSLFPVDLKERVWYDNGVGSDFSGLFFVPQARSPIGEPGTSNDPRHPSGVISFPWVQSLGNLAFCWIDQALIFGWNPFRSIHVPQLTVCVWHLCKTEDFESPAGRCTYHIWYHLFSYHQSTIFQGVSQDGKQHK